MRSLRRDRRGPRASRAWLVLVAGLAMTVGVAVPMGLPVVMLVTMVVSGTMVVAMPVLLRVVVSVLVTMVVRVLVTVLMGMSMAMGAAVGMAGRRSGRSGRQGVQGLLESGVGHANGFNAFPDQGSDLFLTKLIKNSGYVLITFEVFLVVLYPVTQAYSALLEFVHLCRLSFS